MADEEDTDFSDIEGYKAEVDPTTVKMQSVRAKDLPDGTYEAFIRSIQLVKRSGYTLVAADLSLSSGEMTGAAVDHSWFLTSAEDTSRLAADFKTLGVPTELWNRSKRPLAELIQAACVALTKQKIRFGKTTRTRKSDGQEFTNVNIYGLVSQPTKMPTAKTAEPAATEEDEPLF